jgi:4-carboxymuconolactone decarboxylase
MSTPRIPPRPYADWDAEVRDALSVLRLPGSKPDQPAADEPAPERPRLRREPSNLVSTFLQHPRLAKAFLVFNNHLFSSTLSDRARELVAVRVCWLRRGEYEWAQHVQLARAAGMSEAEIEAISEGPGAAVWGPLDAALIRAVDEMLEHHYVSDETWALLAEHLDRHQLMDLVFTAGAYDMLCMAFNTFGLELDGDLSGFGAAKEDDGR